MQVRDLLIFHPDGSAEFRVRVRINGVDIGPGIRFNHDMSYGGIDYDWILAHLDDRVS